MTSKKIEHFIFRIIVPLLSVRAGSLPPHRSMIHSLYLITSSVNLIILPKVLRGADRVLMPNVHWKTMKQL